MIRKALRWIFQCRFNLSDILAVSIAINIGLSYGVLLIIVWSYVSGMIEAAIE